MTQAEALRISLRDLPLLFRAAEKRHFSLDVEDKGISLHKPWRGKKRVAGVIKPYEPGMAEFIPQFPQFYDQIVDVYRQLR